MTRAFSLSMPAHSEPAMEPLGIVQLTPMLSKGIFGVHTKHRGNQLWWENSSTSSLAEVAMCQGSKWEVWLWSFKLPQTAGIKDPTLKYQGADRAPWLVSVIPAGAEPLCVHVRNLLGSGSCWEAIMALAPLLGRGLCLPLQAAGGSHRWSNSYSSQTWSYLLCQLLQLWVSHCYYPGWNLQPCYSWVFPSVHCSSFNIQGNVKEPECKVLYVQHCKGRVLPVWCLLESHKRSCWGLTWSVTHSPTSAEYSQLSFAVGK